MSVIFHCPSEIKALQVAAHDLFRVENSAPVTPRVFEALHVANARAYAISDEGGDLDAEAVAELRRLYAQAQPAPLTYTPAELLDALHGLTHNCLSNGGTFTVESEEEQERRLMQSVAFEVMAERGPAVHVAAFGNIRRVSFDLYQITTGNPKEGPQGHIYLLEGSKPHPLEGFVTDRPWEAFTNLWKMHDDCAAHWEAAYEREMAAETQRLRTQ
jgi:hypothetical protein